MRTPHRLLALITVAVLAVGGAWLASRWLGAPYSGPSVALGAELEEEPEVPESPVTLLAPQAEGEPLEVTREAVPEPSAKPTELAELKVPDDAIWVEGRVIFPRDTPPDEHVRVVARGKAFPGTKKVRTHEVEVAADGSFRAAFAPKTRTGYVRLEAHYLYLEENVKVDARELPDEVLLEPHLGGRVILTVTAPAGADSGALDEVTVQGYVEGVGTEQMFMPQITTEHEHGSFELSSLRPGEPLHVGVTSPTCCNRTMQLDGLGAGETRELALALIRGVRLTGRALDEDGAPVKDLRVWATTGSGMATDSEWTGMLLAHSDDEGRFDLRGIAPGVLVLRANHLSYLEQSQELGNLKDGDLRQDLELRLEQGGVVSGLVQWPDGSPVAGARVEVQQQQEEQFAIIGFGPDLSVKSDADGRFRITGLGNGRCTVKARARQEREAGEGQGLLARRRSGLGSRRGPYWRVTVEDVVPSGPELVLVLRGGGMVAGRVVDDTGAAVERFKVYVREPRSGRSGFVSTNTKGTVSDTFRSEDGHFTLGGVQEGKWVATASARGYGSSAALSLSMPQSGDLVLVVPREATVTGFVLDPDGRPLSGAQVVAELREANWRDSFGMDGALSGKDGSFELDLAPGEHEIHAAGDAFAESVHETLVVTAAEIREGLVLTLRRAARVTGVLDPSVGELAGREVNLTQVNGSRWDDTKTDDRGRFQFDGLEPGRYRLRLQAPPVLDDNQGAKSFNNVVGSSTTLTFDLSEGEERDVVLGTVLSSSVRVSGRVTAGGTPAPELTLHWNSQNGGAQRTATTDANGRYELEVDDTGLFKVKVVLRSGGYHLEALVPEGASVFAFDIDLPTARISGRVVGPDGEPAALAFVILYSRGEYADPRRIARSLEDGTFLLEHLKPGTYELMVSGTRRVFDGGSARFGTRRIHDLEVSETGIEGLELSLLSAASIEGTITYADGSSASRSSVLITDDQGRSIGPWSRVWTDETGRYTFKGLEPGRYILQAERRTSSTGGHEVRLTEGVTYTLDMTLDH